MRKLARGLFSSHPARYNYPLLVSGPRKRDEYQPGGRLSFGGRKEQGETRFVFSGVVSLGCHGEALRDILNKKKNGCRED